MMSNHTVSFHFLLILLTLHVWQAHHDHTSLSEHRKIHSEITISQMGFGGIVYLKQLHTLGVQLLEKDTQTL